MCNNCKTCHKGIYQKALGYVHTHTMGDKQQATFALFLFRLVVFTVRQQQQINYCDATKLLPDKRHCGHLKGGMGNKEKWHGEEDIFRQL